MLAVLKERVFLRYFRMKSFQNCQRKGEGETTLWLHLALFPQSPYHLKKSVREIDISSCPSKFRPSSRSSSCARIHNCPCLILMVHIINVHV